MLLPPLVKLILLSASDWSNVGLSLNSTASFSSLWIGSPSISSGLWRLLATVWLASSVNLGTANILFFSGLSLTHLSSSFASFSSLSRSPCCSRSSSSLSRCRDRERFNRVPDPFLPIFVSAKLVKLPVFLRGCCVNSGQTWTASLLLACPMIFSCWYTAAFTYGLQLSKMHCKSSRQFRAVEPLPAITEPNDSLSVYYFCSESRYVASWQINNFDLYVGGSIKIVPKVKVSNSIYNPN